MCKNYFFFKTIFFTVFFILPFIGFGQNASTYCFSATSGTYTPLSSATDVPGIYAGDNEMMSDQTSLPFNFTFSGIAYNKIKISDNGWLTFNMQLSYLDAFYDNSPNNAQIGKTILAPLWDDLSCTKTPQYQVTGVSPNRIFKVEWSEQKWYWDSSPDVISFQVWLYETTNVIEYHYKQGVNLPYPDGATIGIYDDKNTYLTLNGTGTSPVAQSTVFNVGLVNRPATGQRYTFSPPKPIPSAPLPITGKVAPCASVAGQVYSIANVANATTYIWSVPSGWTLTAGQGTNSITVTTGSAGSNGNISVKAANVCGSSAARTVAVTSSTPPTITASSLASQTSCKSGVYNPITVTVAGDGLTYQWYSNTSNTSQNWISLGATNGAQTNSYIPQSTQAGTLYYYCVIVGTCNVTTSTISGAFTTTTGIITPTVGTITQPTCIKTTASVALSGLPASGAWSITAVPNTPGLTGVSGSGSSTVVAGLIENTTYTFTVSQGGCSSLATSNVVIARLLAKYNNGWVNGVPTINQSIVFEGDYSDSADLVGCDCKINSGITVTIPSGTILKLTRGLQVMTSGKITFENNASLVQIEDGATNLGAIFYKRTTTPISNFDYTYWSAPVKNQKLLDVSPATLPDKFSSYDSAIDNWKPESPTNNMLLGKGYIIRGPQTHAGTTLPYTALFKGEPNNGIITTPIGKVGNSNLIGNPYPSALDANSFLSFNSAVIEGTIYFWTHNTDIGTGVSNPGSGVYAYSSDDYASYNVTGGVGTKAISATNNIPGLVNNYVPSGKIASGQAFFATSKAVGNATFNNSMRVNVGAITGNNSQFFKTSSGKLKRKETIEKNRIWLNLTNANGAFKQLLIGYITGASNEYEDSHDGESFDGNEFVDFYSIIQDKNLVIQGRALPFDQADSVVLGYRSTIEGTFRISIEQTDGALTNQTVYLEDKIMNVTHDLKTAAYEFNTLIGTFDDRFVLRYSQEILANHAFEKFSDEIVVSKEKNELKIKSEFETIKRITIFDFLGKKILDKENLNTNEFRSSTSILNNQIGIVSVTLRNGRVISKKISF